jgi:hypothetical protein
MIEIDGDIWPRRVKGRAKEVIEGLPSTSAVLKQPNSESSLDRGVSDASHFLGVRGTNLFYIRQKLFLSSSHSRDATSYMGEIPTFFVWRLRHSGNLFDGISCISLFDIISAVFGSISRFLNRRRLVRPYLT